jgi:hypothetical protein
MDDLIARLRRDADLEEAEGIDEVASDAPLDNELLAAYFDANPGPWSDAALDWLSRKYEPGVVQVGRALTASLPRPIGRTVQEALSGPTSLARSALISALRISVDAAELLLERPASSLMSYDPIRVGAAAEACGRSRGQIFAAVADSVRAGDPYVFAYRPGITPSVPAKRVTEGTDQAEALLAWGRALFDESDGGQTRP